MESKIVNTKRNIIASYILMIIQTVFQFISKSLIVYTLGEQYLGLSSLFASLLTVLNVAELGFTSSIVYFMYRPLADHNIKRVNALLAYLRKVYKIVGSIIVLGGFLSIFFLSQLISGNLPEDVNIYLLYLIYLANTSIGYFLAAHKIALLTAVQRLDLIKIANCLAIIIQYVLQIIALLVLKNYYLFVISMVLGTSLTNILAAYLSEKKFPQYKCEGKISYSDKREIWLKVKGLLICNVSIVTYSTLDNVVISTFSGLASVAIYSNYMTIYKTVNQLIVMIRTAMQSSIGNSVASETTEKNLHDIFLWQFLFSIISTWCASCMLCLYQPFMLIWMGKKLLLPTLDVVLIVIWFSIDIVQQAHYLYLTAAGLWNDLKYSYIFNVICNFLLNILLGKYLGITGIIIASLTTCIISGTFWQCIIIFKKYFGISAKKYILTQFKYFANSLIIVLLTYYICNFFSLEKIYEFIFRAVICTIVSSFFILIFYKKNKHMNETIKLAKRVLKK